MDAWSCWSAKADNFIERKELTLDEIRRAKERAIKAQNGEASQERPESLADGELSEDELLDVAGGFTLEELWDLLLLGKPYLDAKTVGGLLRITSTPC